MTDSALVSGERLLELGWAAGVFDALGKAWAEGTTVHACVRSVDRCILDRLVEAFGGRVSAPGSAALRVQLSLRAQLLEWVPPTGDAGCVLFLLFPLLSESQQVVLRALPIDWQKASQHVW